MRTPTFQLAWSLRESWRKGYSFADFLSDLKAGLTVGIVAIPLSMALGISSGVSPQNGLYTLIVAGIFTALLGGSRFQITGPTAAFVVLLVPIVQQYGIIGLFTAGFLSGIILILFGLMKMGTFVKLIPHPVITGFSSGIAVVIAVIQLQDFFGLQLGKIPEDFPERIHLLINAFPHWSPQALMMGIYTLSLLFIFIKFFKRIPAPIAAILISSVVVYFLQQISDAVHIDTVNSRFHYIVNGAVFHGIPGDLPTFNWSNIDLHYGFIKKLLNSSLAVAILAAIESLLSAVVADGMTQTRHNPNAELIALGVSNMLCPFFGGIPATGAIARTATNVRFGARSALSGIIHGLAALIVLKCFSYLMGYIPMASLAAVLLMVAYNMSEKHHFMNIMKYAALDDKLVLLSCFAMTVVFDMTVGIGLGMTLAALLFIRRVSSLAKIELVDPLRDKQYDFIKEFKDDLFFFRISGPLFFGAAERAVSAILNTSNEVKTVILDGEKIDLVDTTGMTALYSAISELLLANKQVILITAHSTMLKILEKGAPHVLNHHLFHHVQSQEQAIQLYRELTHFGDITT